MNYKTEYITCRICGSDKSKFLGVRGNQEYEGAPKLLAGQEHIKTNVVKCRECGFIYTNPMILLPEQKHPALYEDPEAYLSSANENPLKMFNRSLAYIEKFTRHKGKILDIGAGKGEFMSAAKEKGWDVYGVEPSANFRSYAKEKFGLEIYGTDLDKIGLPDNYFDVITMNMVLEHIDEPHKLLSVVNKLLKKGGLLYIEVPNMESGLLKLINFYYRIKGRNWNCLLSPLHWPYHCYGYQSATLKRLCGMRNFRVKKTAVFGIGMRGFRSSCGENKLKQKARNALANLAAYLGQGDILITLAIKQ